MSCQGSYTKFCLLTRSRFRVLLLVCFVDPHGVLPVARFIAILRPGAGRQRKRTPGSGVLQRKRMQASSGSGRLGCPKVPRVLISIARGSSCNYFQWTLHTVPGLSLSKLTRDSYMYCSTMEYNTISLCDNVVSCLEDHGFEFEAHGTIACSVGHSHHGHIWSYETRVQRATLKESACRATASAGGESPSKMGWANMEGRGGWWEGKCRWWERKGRWACTTTPFPPPPPPPGPARQQNVNHDVVWGVMQKLVEKL